jgi:hypothetical protein
MRDVPSIQDQVLAALTAGDGIAVDNRHPVDATEERSGCETKDERK